MTKILVFVSWFAHLSRMRYVFLTPVPLLRALLRPLLRNDTQTDEWMVDMLRSFVICVTPIAGQKSSPDTEEILERSTLDGRTLLHFAARNRLIRTCSILIEEAHINLNGFRKREKWRRGGKVTDFRTPLDEAIKAKKGIARWVPRLVSEDGELYHFLCRMNEASFRGI